MPDRATFDAGSPALTLASMANLEGVEDYPGLVGAFLSAALIAPEHAIQLLEHARASPLGAEEALAEGRVMARVLHRIFTALAGKAAPTMEDMSFLNDCIGRCMANIVLAPTTGTGGAGYDWAWRSNGRSEPGAMLWPVVRDAAELLVGQDPARIRRCQGKACDRLFLDSSKAGRRRWCQMETCGNRAKARRHARRSSKAVGRHT